MPNTIDYMRNGLAFAHRALTDARNGTDEQLHFVPPKGSHSIAWCMWHTARIEDVIINMRSQGKPQIWNEEWAKRTGLPVEGFGTNMTDEEAQALRIKDMGAFAEYQDAVWSATDKFFDNVTEAELDRELPTRDGGTETVGEGIQLHMLGHFNGHRGEINTLRGMQGMPTVLMREGTH